MSDFSQENSGEGDDKPGAVGSLLDKLIDRPGAVALWGLVAALILSVLMKFEMPAEFWLALTGLLTGLGHGLADSKNGRSGGSDGG